MKIEGYLLTKEVAEKLKVSVGRVQQLVAQKRLIAVKIGQTNLVKESDVEQFIKLNPGKPKNNKVQKA